MKRDHATTLEQSKVDAIPQGWTLTAALAIGLVLWLVVWYRETALSIAAIWQRSETFAHGYLIVPISVYLIWTRRQDIARLRPAPSYFGVPLMAVIGFGWLVAYLGQVQVVQQYAMVAMIPALLLTLLGPRVTMAMAFPLGFLLLGVPVGEALIPHMMDFTADFTVAALQITGIPVYREGTFFNIPSGNWSVVEGCSGLRYLIASFTLGCLYAYLTYRSTTRRLIFAALSVVVPIIANGLRAYMIVMIAHLSDMKLALGVDHYIYGWVFFGLVMLLLFWIGSFWREDDPQPRPEQNPVAPQPGRIALKPMVVAALASVVIAGVWPVYAAYLERQTPQAKHAMLRAPAAAGGWQLETTPLTDWRPHYLGADTEQFVTYRKGNQVVALYLGYYRYQRQDAELINSQNVMVVQKHPLWNNIGETQREEQLAGAAVKLRQTLLRSPSQHLLTWDWFLVSERYTSSAYLAKLLLARDRLLQNSDDGAAIILTTPYEERLDGGEQTLRAFIHDMLPAIETVLHDVAQS